MIVVLVEGDCEMNVLKILIYRAWGRHLIKRCIDMRGKSNIVRVRNGFEDTIRRQIALGNRSFIVLMDGDAASAPYASIDEERHEMQRRAQALAQELDVTIQTCWAVIETESWLIGGIRAGSNYCGLREVGQVPANTQTIPQDPKRWLREHLRKGYDPQAQRCLAQQIDLQEAKMRNHSMRIFLDCFEHEGAAGRDLRRSRRRR